MTAEEILFEIDAMARDVDHYSFGLPSYNNDAPTYFWSRAIKLIEDYKNTETA